MRTLISPELVWTSYNVAVSLCSVLRNVTILTLSRISSFKRIKNYWLGVSTCLYDLSITWSLKYNIWRRSQTDFSLWQYWGKFQNSPMSGGHRLKLNVTFPISWLILDSKSWVLSTTSTYWRQMLQNFCLHHWKRPKISLTDCPLKATSLFEYLRVRPGAYLKGAHFGVTCKHWTRMESLARDKRSSLFGLGQWRRQCYNFDSWGLCYKTFYGRNLWVFVITSSVCPWQAFPVLNNVCG